MNKILNGVELINTKGNKALICYFDSDNLYFSIGLNAPIVFEGVHDDTIQQLGDFFYYRGKNPEVAATRIDFHNLRTDSTISIKIMGTIIYFGQEKLTVAFESIGPSELKRFGTWLRKEAK